VVEDKEQGAGDVSFEWMARSVAISLDATDVKTLAIGFDFQALFTRMYPISANSVPGCVSIPFRSSKAPGIRVKTFLGTLGFASRHSGLHRTSVSLLLQDALHCLAIDDQSIESNLGFTVLLGDPGWGKPPCCFSY